MHDLLPQIIFYGFAGLTISSALMVITQSNPVRCVLFLVFAFFTSAVLWILAGAEFLALILVLVYVGAVMTLFLFVVMMLNSDIETMRKQWMGYLPLGLILVALLVALLMTALPKKGFESSSENAVSHSVSSELVSVHPKTASLTDTEALGLVLYTDYVLAFELAAVILLVAIIAAITLVHRAPIRSKQQNIVKQIMTRRDDRVRLLTMKSEKP
jgi:NADH-quinone oxidoreductase subunit J